MAKNRKTGTIQYGRNFYKINKENINNVQKDKFELLIDTAR